MSKVAKSVGDTDIQAWLWLMLSSIIITKNPGPSRARDLSHSRPHRTNRKNYKRPLDLFERRFVRALDEIDQMPVAANGVPVKVGIADCRERIPLPSDSVDLIVTSPPYAGAIDYLRSHKFSLVWMGYSLRDIGDIRKKHIGATGGPNGGCQVLTPALRRKIRLIRRAKGRTHNFERYFLDLDLVIREMYRVLKPGRPLVMVVAPCSANGYRLDIHRHVSNLLEEAGFKVSGWARRRLDRNKRMLPVSSNGLRRSRIEHRILREYIVGAIKPLG